MTVRSSNVLERSLHKLQCSFQNVNALSRAQPRRSPARVRHASVVHAARNVFSEQVLKLTSIVDLERHTGLDRSSLYNAFGSKQALFEAAMRSYLEEGIESRLSALRQPEAGLKTVTQFFVGMAHTLRANPVRQRVAV